MAALPPIRILSKPGIKRDGTQLEGDNYIDGQWVRWQRGLPRKMLGYKQLTAALSGPVREVNADTSNGFTIIHSFSKTGIERIAVDNVTGVPTGVIDRTPGGFVANANYDWTTSSMWNAGGTNNVVVAHVAPNLGKIDNETGGLLYLGDLATTAAFTQITDANITGTNALAGGIVVLHPYLVVFGQAGGVAWSVANTPTDFTSSGSGRARVTSSKIVAGLVLRGGPGASPSGLLWSTNALIRMYFTGGSTVFGFDTISDTISIMSPNAVCEFEGIYYWVGADKFYMFNGSVREMPNEMNRDWFFDNLNQAQRTKVYAYAKPRWGEIWFCYPRGNATECTHAVVFNVRESARAGAAVWYDTALPANMRTTGLTPQVFPYPLTTGGTTISGKYQLLQEEIGYDAVEGSPIQSNAIDSYFETNSISLVTGSPFGQAMDKALNIEQVEPDFTQLGDMTLAVNGNANARASDVEGDPQTFSPPPVAASGQLLGFKDVQRQMRFKFRSNVVGGYYEMGHCLAHVNSEDGRRTA